MSNTIEMKFLLSVDPDAARRAERLQFAADLLNRKHPQREVTRRVRTKYGCSHVTAWRTVSAAKDMTDE